MAMLTPNEKQSEVLKGPDAMRIIGLTGGIASGKGEVARVFADCGVPVLNADAIGHEAIAPGGPGYQAVVQAFGDGILRDGIIDRSALGNVVFCDDAALEKLNRIVHPLIRDEIERRCERLARQGHKFCLIDAALIAEDGVRPPFLDILIVVNASPESRLRRLVEIRGFSEEHAAHRIEAQTDPESKLRVADYVIENDGDVQELRQKAQELAETITRGVA